MSIDFQKPRLIQSLPCTEPNYEEKKCLNVYWKIKNFSFCMEGIKSPQFVYGGDQWWLQLDPNNLDCKIASLNFRGPNAQISFLTCDGSQEESGSSCSSFTASKNKVFGERRSAFLPKDTLTIRCRFPTPNERGKILIESRIGVNRKIFVWPIHNFSQETHHRQLSIESSDQHGNILLSIKSVGGIITDKQFYIKIFKIGGEKSYCTLKVSVLDAHGKAVNHVSDEFVFEKEDKEQFWRFPPIIRSSKLLASKDVLLPNDKLSIQCDFTITVGKTSEQSIVSSYNNDVKFLLKESDNLSTYLKEGSISDSVTDLKTDLKSILDNGTLCDVNLQVGSEVFHAHRNILSVRSAFFKAMFTKESEETTDKTVIIDDSDVDTFRRLLYYLYSEDVRDYQCKDIILMYFAAIRYGVLSLKLKCASFLKENFSFANVCEVLLLADAHQDADLKSAALDFIFKYDSEIFTSEPWKEFDKNNFSLALQTMRDISSRKLLD